MSVRRDQKPSANKMDKARREDGQSARRAKISSGGKGSRKNKLTLVSRYGKKNNKAILKRAMAYVERTMALQPASALSVSGQRAGSSPTSFKSRKHVVVSPCDSDSPHRKRRDSSGNGSKSNGEKVSKKARMSEGH